MFASIYKDTVYLDKHFFLTLEHKATIQPCFQSHALLVINCFFGLM